MSSKPVSLRFDPWQYRRAARHDEADAAARLFKCLRNSSHRNHSHAQDVFRWQFRDQTNSITFGLGQKRPRSLTVDFITVDQARRKRSRVAFAKPFQEIRPAQTVATLSQQDYGSAIPAGKRR